MRRLATAFGLAAMWATPALASDYWWVDSSVNGTYFIDASRIEQNADGSRRALVLAVYKTDFIENHGYAYSLSLVAFDCSGSHVSVIRQNDYRSHGGFVSSQTFSEPTHDEVAPGSIGESEVKFVCMANDRPRGGFSELGDVSTAGIVRQWSQPGSNQ